MLAPDKFRAESLTALWDSMEVSSPIPGGELKFFAPTPILRARAASVMSKEPETIEWLDTLTPPSVLWDIGANVGLFSLYAAVARRCTVLAFEPSAANYAVLARNVQINRVTDRLTAYCVALSGVTELGVLNLDSPAMGTAMTQFGHAGEKSRYSSNDTPMTHGMIGITVDEFIERFAPPFPTHIKLDVDGLEWPILQGAARTLRDRRVTSIIAELSITQRDERDTAIAFLEAAGFTLAVQGSPQGEPGEQGANHLFVRK